MKATRLIALACLIAAFCPALVASTLSAGAPCFTRIDGPVAIPAEITDHVMFVNVMVNERGPFRVMVDTGCSVSVVSPKLAEAVGAMAPDFDEVEDPIYAENGLGDPTDVQRVLLSSIELGGVRFESVTAIVSDSFQKLSTIEGTRVDGMLGFPLFADLYLGLDFPNHQLILAKQWPTTAPAICTSLPVVEHADVPFVQVQIQGRSVELMIDSGSNQALQLTNNLAPEFQWKVAPRIGSLVAVLGEVGREGIGRLAGSMALGDLQYVEPTTIVSAGPSSLGLRSLERFCVIFHQSENRVWLCGANAEPILPTAERSVGLSFYSDRGGLRIAGVIPGSPADEAHLTAGSLVTQIEHRSATSWTREQMEEWIESHADIALVVTEKTGERALRLRGWDLVP
jgi:hypothetical protein